jgi:hypothetical protein
MLGIIDQDGQIFQLKRGEVEGFLRFELFSECLLLLRDEEGFGWVNALDRYSQLGSDEGQGVDHPEFIPPVLPFRATVQHFRDRLNTFLEAVKRNASTGEMGTALRGVFAGTCGMLVATELEIQRRRRAVAE